MKKRLLVNALMLLVFFLGIGGQAYAQFTVQEDFKGSSTKKNNVIFIGGAYLTASDNATVQKDNNGDGWLRLTEAKGTKSGGVIIDEAFSSDKGVVLDFEYKTWRTKEGADDVSALPAGTPKRGGDGFTVFLLDGNTLGDRVTLGGTGHNLGYGGSQGYNDALTNGYLGLGLDEYGNYIFAGTNGIREVRLRKDGYWYEDGTNETEQLRYSLKNSVGLRGKSNYQNNTPLIGYKTIAS
ncbi:L-type lectin family protein [Myroides pelagicus]|uniref:T9SS C-terminal target domain-containing protein n=1 Tax=Myroides pelagicus TaxID=270914 RepID=A0A7K1GLU0_9FLAO|nr:hypothetical protein [Myroides pelagicus]MEC4114309.1 hypothetical protein [Myroides pelagicus]MTH29837.1 hypothetical protein [Myroides pelagicus]